MKEAVNEIVIRGTREQVQALAFDLPAWPAFLPHYRWVKVLAEDDDRKTIEMACWRTGIPLRWRSHLWVLPAEGRMRFQHVAGPACGMNVEWRVVQEGDRVRVTIHHDLALKVPLIRTALGRWIVGEVFVRAVARKTLAHLKLAVEQGG